MFERLYHTEDKPGNQESNGPPITPMVPIIEEQKHSHNIFSGHIYGPHNFSRNLKSFQDNSVSNTEIMHMQRIDPRGFNLEDEDDSSAVGVDLSALEDNRKGDEWNSMNAHIDPAADINIIQTPIDPAVNMKLK